MNLHNNRFQTSLIKIQFSLIILNTFIRYRNETNLKLCVTVFFITLVIKSDGLDWVVGFKANCPLVTPGPMGGGMPSEGSF